MLTSVLRIDLLICIVTALAACAGPKPSAPSTSYGPADAAAGGAANGQVQAFSCDGVPAVTLDELWTKYLAPSQPTGCAVAGCHASGAGNFAFTTPHELWQASVSKPASARKELMRVEPGDPTRSYLYLQLLPTAPARMPLGGPYLSDKAIAAAWPRRPRRSAATCRACSRRAAQP